MEESTHHLAADVMFGGVVLLGQRTSKFTKAQFSDWVEFLYATAALRGVKLPAWQAEAA